MVSHLGNPKLMDGRLAHGPELFQLDQEAGVLVLISGLSMFWVYPYAELREFVSDVIRRFGPQRLMWGSNFPVCGDAAAYQRDLIHFQTGEWGVSSDAIDAIVGGTARNLWFGEGGS